jgi:hypothetical protein
MKSSDVLVVERRKEGEGGRMLAEREEIPKRSGIGSSLDAYSRAAE